MFNSFSSGMRGAWAGIKSSFSSGAASASFKKGFNAAGGGAAMGRMKGAFNWGRAKGAGMGAAAAGWSGGRGYGMHAAAGAGAGIVANAAVNTFSDRRGGYLGAAAMGAGLGMGAKFGLSKMASNNPTRKIAGLLGNQGAVGGTGRKATRPRGWRTASDATFTSL